MVEVADFLNENNLLRFPNPIEIETQRQVHEEPLAKGTALVPGKEPTINYMLSFCHSLGVFTFYFIKHIQTSRAK